MALARQDSLESEFEAASRKYGVPPELLLAMGHVNALWEMPPPSLADYEEGDLHGRGAYGVMQLYKNPSLDTLGQASSLTSIPEEKLKKDRAAAAAGNENTARRSHPAHPSAIAAVGKLSLEQRA